MSDLIRREEAIEMLQEAIDSYPPTMKGQGRTRDSTLEEAIDLIKSIPTVEPKVGTWFDHSDEGYVQCPFCGSLTTCEDNIDELHYCFNCGAKMERSK